MPSNDGEQNDDRRPTVHQIDASVMKEKITTMTFRQFSTAARFRRLAGRTPRRAGDPELSPTSDIWMNGDCASRWLQSGTRLLTEAAAPGPACADERSEGETNEDGHENPHNRLRHNGSGALNLGPGDHVHKPDQPGDCSKTPQQPDYRCQVESVFSISLVLPDQTQERECDSKKSGNERG